MSSIFDLVNLVASNMWLYGGTFVLVLSILVFVHEWGHYIVARLCGVRIETFSIGFGKEIVGFNDKHGTRWKISLVPLGGYVKMFGDTDPSSAGHTDEVKDGQGAARPMTANERGVAFFAKSVWKRAAIVIAGPAINFLFAIIVLAALYSFYGQPVTPPSASAIIEGSAADKAGFEPHDKVIAIDGSPIKRFEDIRREVMIALDRPMNFTVRRGEKEITLTATPVKEVITDHFGFEHSRGLLGIIGPANGILLDTIQTVNGRKVEGTEAVRKAVRPLLGKEFTITLKRADGKADTLVIRPSKDLQGWNDAQSPNKDALVVAHKIGEDYVKHGLIGGVGSALEETWNITVGTMTALGQMFTGTRSPTELGGIIRIGAIAGDMAQAGIIALISFTALLSINLGLINLFPIPMLDGGHLVFYAVEAVKGSPIPEKIQDYAFRFGLAVLVGIMIFANLNDLIQLIL